MRRMILLLAVIGLVAAGCGGNGEDAGQPQGDGDNASQVAESTEDELPENFPSDFPLPEDNRVVYSVVSEGAQVVFFDSDLAYEDLRAFLAEQLGQSGWTLQVCQETNMGDEDEQATVMIAVKVERMATIMVGYVPLPQSRFQGRYAFNVALQSTGEPVQVEEPATC